MKAPKCRLCGREHYGLCSRLAADNTRGHAGTGVRNPPADSGVEAQRSANNRAAPVPREIRSDASRTADDLRDKADAAVPKFDRIAYQREYMRKRRAKQKETRGQQS